MVRTNQTMPDKSNRRYNRYGFHSPPCRVAVSASPLFRAFQYEIVAPVVGKLHPACHTCLAGKTVEPDSRARPLDALATTAGQNY